MGGFFSLFLGFRVRVGVGFRAVVRTRASGSLEEVMCTKFFMWNFQIFRTESRM